MKAESQRGGLSGWNPTWARIVALSLGQGGGGPPPPEGDQGVALILVQSQDNQRQEAMGAGNKSSILRVRYAPTWWGRGRDLAVAQMEMTTWVGRTAREADQREEAGSGAPLDVCMMT